MLFGKQKNETPPDDKTSALSAEDIVFDATDADFEQSVLRASMERPVIVDFWAPWCGPCKQLGPVLEKTVAAANGAVLMAKVNIDENPGIAQALRIQSIPTVYAFFQGKPVDGFQGAVPESQVKTFIDKLIKISLQAAPDAIDIPAALKQAAQALIDKDFHTAQGLYSHILNQDKRNAAAYVGLVRTLIAAGVVDEARQLVDNATPEISVQSIFSEARSAVEIAENKPSGSTDALLAKVAKDPNDHQGRFDLALAQFSQGEKEEAMDSLLEIIRRKRDWNEDAARMQLIKFFEALGPTDPLTVQGRRKLSSILFS
jgi:putative thioredoxin